MSDFMRKLEKREELLRKKYRLERRIDDNFHLSRIETDFVGSHFQLCHSIDPYGDGHSVSKSYYSLSPKAVEQIKLFYEKQAEVWIKELEEVERQIAAIDTINRKEYYYALYRQQRDQTRSRR